MRLFSAAHVSIFSALLMTSADLHGAVHVATGHEPADAGFKAGAILPPATNDAAARATWTVVDGRKDASSAEPVVLADGKVPAGDDEPGSNFFFAQGTDGGRIVADLGEITPVKSVASYSWHRGSRAPQAYRLYAASGKEAGFNPSPKQPVDPKTCGWNPVAAADTRGKENEGGGQHAVEITAQGGKPLGEYRYLLFDIQPASKSDAFGNTFFSEIDIVSTKDPALERFRRPVRIVKEHASRDGKFRYILDSTRAPELTGWTEKELLPVIEEWYPKLVALLPSDHYQAPAVVFFEYQPDIKVPAYATGNRITLNAGWFPRELNREAKGCVVHEMGHVVQNYWRARIANPDAKDTPGWVTEGICDYIRWFLFEPQSNGAGIPAEGAGKANYDKSYRTTGNFLDWVVTERDRDLLKKLNAAAREGRYEEGLWKDWTGKTLQELNGEWKDAIKAGKRVQK